jgi:hypothetical protein
VTALTRMRRQCSLLSPAASRCAEFLWEPFATADAAPDPARALHCFPCPDALTRFAE